MALVGEAHVIIRADTSLFQKEIEKALQGVRNDVGKLGKDIGRDLSKNINSGSSKKGPFDNFLKDAERAKDKFNSLIKKGYAIGPVMSGAASAISDVAQGLFAVGSAVGAAAPALVALPGIFAAIAQGALTAKIAFGGVMKGIQALNKQKTGAGTDTGQGAANQRAIEDARKRLAKVYQGTAEQMAAANDKVRKAQNSLNQAYQEGAEALQQLGFNAEDAALAQDKAAIQLERARESLLRTQDVPVDSRARREAEIAFKEAELNYRQAKDKSNDLAKAQEYAAKTGIEGTKEVISAKQELAQAEADRAKTERDNAQDIADAQLALQRALEDAAKKANKAASSTNDLLKDLSKEARAFALHVADMRDKFLELRHAAGKELFGPLTIALDKMVNSLFPVLRPILTAMGGVVGRLAQQFATMLTRVQNLDIFKRVFGGTNLKVMENVGDALVAMAEAALNVLDAARPLVLTFSKWIQHLTNTIRLSAILSNGSGALTDKFNGAGEAAKKLGKLVKNTWQAFSPFGKAAKEAGFMIIDAFNDAMVKMKEFGKAGLYSGDLEKHFKDVATNIIAIGHFLGEVIKMFFELGGNPGVKAFMDQISLIPGLLTPIMQNMTGMGETFGKFLVSVATLITKFAETGGIELFFSILTKAVDAVSKLFNNELVMKVFGFLAALHGVTLALGVLSKVGGFAFKVLFAKLTILPGLATASATSLGVLGGALTAVGNKALLAGIKIEGMRLGTSAGLFAGTKAGFNNAKAGFSMLNEQISLTNKKMMTSMTTSIKSGGIFKSLGRGLVGLARGFLQAAMGALRLGLALVATPIGWITIAVVALVGAFVMMWKNSEKLRKAVSDLGKHLMNSLGKAFQSIKDYIQKFLPAAKNTGSLFKTMGDMVAKYLIPPLKFLGDLLIKIAAFLVKVFLTPILVVIRAIFELVKAVKKVYDWFKRLTGDAVEPLSKSQKKAAEAAREHAKALLQEKHNAKELDRKFKDTGAIYDFLTDKATGAFNAATNHARALIASRDAAKSLRETDKTLAESLKDTTKPITDQKDSLYEFAGSYLDAAEAAVKAGKSSKFVQDIIDSGRDKFIKGATAIGMSSTAAKKLADNLGLSPDTIKKTFKVTGIDELRNLNTELEKLTKATAFSSGFNAKLAAWKKKNPFTGDSENIKQMAAYNQRATAAVNAQIAAAKTKVKSDIAVKMELNFGAGQNKDKPMFVKVTNPDDIKAGKYKDGKYAGGQVKGGSTYLVGERGPELFQAPTSGNIIPNHQVGTGNTINLTVNPSPGMDEREIANLVSRRLAFMQRGA